MGEQFKNMMVGLVMLSACAFTIALILFLKPSVGDGKKTYELRFANINGLNVGTRVLFAGKPVGEVTSIEEIYDARKQPSDLLGRVYFYQLTIHVDSSVTIYNTDQISIQTLGLLGEKSIAIIPTVPPKQIVPQPVGKEPIYAQSTDPLENAFMELSQLANEMEGTFRYINAWLEKNGDTLAGAVSSFKTTLDQAGIALSHFNQSNIIDIAKEGIQAFAHSMQKVDLSLDQLQKGDFFLHASNIVKDLSTGKGTLGRLITDDDMYLRIASLLTKANTTMNDINQYGILFHMNKTWQRERLQKITLMNSLSTPQSFKNYFSKEVDNINTAMERLSMMMDRARTTKERTLIFSNPAFVQDFAGFLRDVQRLTDNVRLYNAELLETIRENQAQAPCSCNY